MDRGFPLLPGAEEVARDLQWIAPRTRLGRGLGVQGRPVAQRQQPQAQAKQDQGRAKSADRDREEGGGQSRHQGARVAKDAGEGREAGRQTGEPRQGGLLKPAAGGSGPRKGTARGRRTLKGTGLLGEVCRGVNWNIRRLFPLLQLAPFLEFPVCLTHADTPGTWRTGLVPLENGAAKTVQRTQCGHPALP